MDKLTRRGLITGLISLVAAPAIVRASSLMPVRAIDGWVYLGTEVHGTPIIRWSRTVEAYWLGPDGLYVLDHPPQGPARARLLTDVNAPPA